MPANVIGGIINDHMVYREIKLWNTEVELSVGGKCMEVKLWKTVMLFLCVFFVLSSVVEEAGKF